MLVILDKNHAWVQSSPLSVLRSDLDPSLANLQPGLWGSDYPTVLQFTDLTMLITYEGCKEVPET